MLFAHLIICSNNRNEQVESIDLIDDSSILTNMKEICSVGVRILFLLFLFNLNCSIALSKTKTNQNKLIHFSFVEHAKFCALKKFVLKCSSLLFSWMMKAIFLWVKTTILVLVASHFKYSLNFTDKFLSFYFQFVFF